MADIKKIKLGDATYDIKDASAVHPNEGGIVEVEKLQHVPDGVAAGFDFTNKNPNATALDPTLTGNISYGAIGQFATALGGKSAAIGKRSLAEGTTTIAKGNYSHAEGDNSVALGADSHAEGYKTTSAGTGSHTEGSETVAQGFYSHAEGGDNTVTADGTYAHVEGIYNTVAHQGAHVSGFGNTSYAKYQTVIGTGSASNSDALFIVGNGEVDDLMYQVTSQSNAFTVNKDGTATLGNATPENDYDVTSKIYVEEKLYNKADYTGTSIKAASGTRYIKICTVPIPVGNNDVYFEFDMAGRSGNKFQKVKCAVFNQNSATDYVSVYVSGNWGNAYEVCAYKYTSGSYVELWGKIPSWDCLNILKKSYADNTGNTYEQYINWNYTVTSALPTESSTVVKVAASLEKWAGKAAAAAVADSATKVAQTAVYDNSSFPVLLANSPNTTDDYGAVRKPRGLTFNPDYYSLSIGTYNSIGLEGDRLTVYGNTTVQQGNIIINSEDHSGYGITPSEANSSYVGRPDNRFYYVCGNQVYASAIYIGDTEDDSIPISNIFAPMVHTSSDASTYGAASASVYGHAKASSTTPKANGTAAVGSQTNQFARGDHVHPLQTVATFYTWEDND